MKEGLRVFDSRTHLGHVLHRGWRYIAEQLLCALDQQGVDLSVVIPFPVVAGYRAAHHEIARTIKAQSERLVGNHCLYPYIGAANYRDELKRCVEELGFRVLKRQPQYQPLDPFPRTENCAGSLRWQRLLREAYVKTET